MHKASTSRTPSLTDQEKVDVAKAVAMFLMAGAMATNGVYSDKDMLTGLRAEMKDILQRDYRVIRNLKDAKWLRPIVEAIIATHREASTLPDEVERDRTTRQITLETLGELQASVALMLESHAEMKQQIDAIFLTLDSKSRKRRRIRIPEEPIQGQVPTIGVVGIHKVGRRRDEVERAVKGHVNLVVINYEMTQPEQLKGLDCLVVHRWTPPAWVKRLQQVYKEPFMKNERGMASLVEMILTASRVYYPKGR